MRLTLSCVHAVAQNGEKAKNTPSITNITFSAGHQFVLKCSKLHFSGVAKKGKKEQFSGNI